MKISEKLKNFFLEYDYTGTYNQSGIMLKDNISLSVSGKIAPYYNLLMILTAFAGSFGTVFTFTSFFDFEYEKSTLIGFMLSAMIIFTVIMFIPKKFFPVIFVMPVLYGVVLYRKSEEFITGYKLIFNSIAQKIELTYKGINFYRIEGEPDELYCITLFLILAAIFITMCVCYISYMNHSFILGFLVTFPIAETGLYNGLLPSYAAFAMLVSYWLSILAMNFCGYRSITSGSYASFIRKKNSFIAKSVIKFRVDHKCGFVMIITAFVIFSLSAMIVEISGFKRSQELDDLRNDIIHKVENFSLSDVSDNFSRLTSSFSDRDLSQNGVLGQEDCLEFENTVMLKVDIDENLNSPVYLKGYVGSKYTGYSWSDLNKSEYREYSQLFDKFSEIGFFPQSFNGISGAKAGGLNSTAFIKSLMGDEKYCYMPYGFNQNSNFSAVSDRLIQSTDMSEYTVSFCHISDYDTLLAYDYSGDISEVADNIESEYAEYVYDMYLRLPEDDDLTEVYEEFSDIASEKLSSASNTSEILDKLINIRKAMSADTEYTLSPGRTPLNRDFVNFFLLENKKGYCSHYAAAGAVLCRMAGVPSRYVEGYIIMPEDFTTNKTPDGLYNIELKDTRAHAWTEIYIKGFGWIPFEFTPGYYSGVVPTEMPEYNPNAITTTPVPTETIQTTVSETTQIPAQTTQNEVTSQPARTSVAGGEVTDFYEQSEPPKPLISENTLKVLKSVLMVIVCAGAVVILTVLKRKLIVRRRDSSIHDEDINKSALNIYGYIIKLLKYIDIDAGNMQYMDFAESCEEKCEYLESGEMKFIVESVLKADLSGDMIDEQERLKMEQISQRLAQKIYDSRHFLDKIYMKYILNLI